MTSHHVTRQGSASGTAAPADETNPADLAALAVRLEQVTANLNGHIVEAADHLARPRIAAAEASAGRQLADLRAEYEARLRRAHDLETELRRQLTAQLRQVARLRWVARYLPAPLRGLVLTDPSRPGAWCGDRPDEQFAVDVDAAAAAVGLTPYPH
ncbi:hypothetical protein [Micromonospora sp. CPCC 206061]|uniref:hypothetical protein n=1 Tax=Micromonospora sp. CPCC 206061 TaxID=3122410 RepID=UPI002FF1950C